jgi:hypothetical protein
MIWRRKIYARIRGGRNLRGYVTGCVLHATDCEGCYLRGDGCTASTSSSELLTTLLTQAAFTPCSLLLQQTCSLPALIDLWASAQWDLDSDPHKVGKDHMFSQPDVAYPPGLSNSKIPSFTRGLLLLSLQTLTVSLSLSASASYLALLAQCSNLRRLHWTGYSGIQHTA